MNLNFNCETGILQQVSSFYTEEKRMESVGIASGNIRFSDRIGKWYMVDVSRIYFITEHSSMFYYLGLSEHQTYGDLAGMILAFFDPYHAEWVELTETWDDIETTALDLCLI